jgi:hypothetical protein
MTVAGVEVPEETDADIRAAVQAALEEIAAATRPGGDHEVPFHFAIRFAGTPPAVVKLPPA